MLCGMLAIAIKGELVVRLQRKWVLIKVVTVNSPWLQLQSGSYGNAAMRRG